MTSGGAPLAVGNDAGTQVLSVIGNEVSIYGYALEGTGTVTVEYGPCPEDVHDFSAAGAHKLIEALTTALVVAEQAVWRDGPGRIAS